MTVHVFIHSNSKRAETISLLDLGATKNFLNINYAKWLNLPIKRLPFPRKLFTVDLRNLVMHCFQKKILANCWQMPSTVNCGIVGLVIHTQVVYMWEFWFPTCRSLLEN